MVDDSENREGWTERELKIKNKWGEFWAESVARQALDGNTFWADILDDLNDK